MRASELNLWLLLALSHFLTYTILCSNTTVCPQTRVSLDSDPALIFSCPVVSTRKHTRLEPGKMIDGYDPLVPNGHLVMKIAAVIGDTSLTNDVGENGSCTELDSHANNMCVLGKQCYVLSCSGKSVDVGAFTESAGGLNEVPIVDTMLAYDCKMTNQVYSLVLRMRTVIYYIECITDNLIPPFILREAGLIVNKRAKIHCKTRYCY